MAAYDNLRNRLPTLYRPESADATLLAAFLQAIGDVLDDVGSDATEVMQAHWVRYADHARYSNWVKRQRELSGQPPLQVVVVDEESGKPTVNQEAVDTIRQFPYIHDLAQIANLLPLPPWRDPAYLREEVEDYRRRIARTIALYKNGLGTVGAIRRMVEAQLPVIDELLPLDQRDQPFWIEEFAPLAAQQKMAATRGAPNGILGALMRFPVDNPSQTATATTVIVEAVEVTDRPMIERFDQKVGLAYTGSLAAGQALRLQPTYASWLASDDSVLQAESATDPTASGGWVSSAGAPSGVSVLLQSADLHLWAGTTDGELWRFDGTSWVRALDGLGEIHALHERGQALLIGTADGLLHMAQYTQPLVTTPIAALNGNAVHAIVPLSTGLWLATDAGAGRLRADNSFDLSALQTPIFAIYADRAGQHYFGGERGLFQYQPAHERWYSYSGMVRDERAGEWRVWDTVAAVEDGEIGLPSVRAIARSNDGALWIGTDSGFACYVARSVRGLSYETILQAFPDISTGRVFFVENDARGLLWIGTENGLFRYDGRQLWQYRADAWVQLGHAASAYQLATQIKRGAWHFQRSSGRWVQFPEPGQPLVNDSVRGTDEAAVRAVVWVRGVSAEIGTFSEPTFTPSEAVPTGQLRVRVKPDRETILSGGIPALPALPTGKSMWRYLSMESDNNAELPPAPAWTSEGRLLPAPGGAEAIVGRYEQFDPPPDAIFDEAVFAYSPVAKVHLQWQASAPLTVLVRLQKRSADQQFDPLVLTRIQQGIEQVRPAGVQVKLAVGEVTN